jgi:hypothetical protein
MQKKEMSSLWQVMETLRKRGYTLDFNMSPEGGVIVSSDNHKYKPQDLYIKKIYRFEGDSDPGDMSILYRMKTKSGKKGLLVDGYGAESSTSGPEFVEFMRQVTIKRKVVDPDSIWNAIKSFFAKVVGFVVGLFSKKKE